MLNQDSNKAPYLVSLLGNPLSHSLSPVIHNSSFAKQGLGLHYFLCPCNEASLNIPIALIRDGIFLGSNVTIPHKKNVIPFLDELSPSAEFVNAVNTISRVKDGDVIKLRGDNTDVEGFFKPLEGHVSHLKSARTLVIGTGGSARAVAYSLLTRLGDVRLTISSRTQLGAETFAEVFNGKNSEWKSVHASTIEELDSQDFDLIVNATPLGMHPHTNASPCPDSWKFREEQIVYDLIYNPDETLLLKRARQDGATTLNGLEMLIQQAAASYKIWTGREMDLAEVRKNLV